MIKLYGPGTSRVLMCKWVLDETGAEHEHVAMEFAEVKSPEFRKLNPNAKVPLLEDGDFKLFESMAIALYVAQTCGHGSLWPENAHKQGHALQWAFWSATELEPHMVTMFGQTLFTPPDQRDEKRLGEAREKAQAAMRVLDGELSGRGYLLGDDFTIADITVASVLAPAAKMLELDFSELPALDAWRGRVTQREHYQPMVRALEEFAERIKKGPPPSFAKRPPEGKA